jgi:hypothetical protein
MLLGDLLHALRYLLGRGVRPQFHTHFAHVRRQVQICRAPAANAGSMQALPWKMALPTNRHGEGLGRGGRRRQAHIGSGRLRMRPSAEFRKYSQAPSDLAFADSATRTDFCTNHLDRISVEELGRQGGKNQHCCRRQIARQDGLRRLGPALYRGSLRQ